MPCEFSEALAANTALLRIVIFTSSSVLSFPHSFFFTFLLVLPLPGLLLTTLKLRISFKLTTFGTQIVREGIGEGL